MKEEMFLTTKAMESDSKKSESYREVYRAREGAMAILKISAINHYDSNVTQVTGKKLRTVHLPSPSLPTQA